MSATVRCRDGGPRRRSRAPRKTPDGPGTCTRRTRPPSASRNSTHGEPTSAPDAKPGSRKKRLGNHLRASRAAGGSPSCGPTITAVARCFCRPSRRSRCATVVVGKGLDEPLTVFKLEDDEVVAAIGDLPSDEALIVRQVVRNLRRRENAERMAVDSDRRWAYRDKKLMSGSTQYAPGLASATWRDELLGLEGLSGVIAVE